MCFSQLSHRTSASTGSHLIGWQTAADKISAHFDSEKDAHWMKTRQVNTSEKDTLCMRKRQGKTSEKDALWMKKRQGKTSEKDVLWMRKRQGETLERETRSG